jgi:hypothetical protein
VVYLQQIEKYIEDERFKMSDVYKTYVMPCRKMKTDNPHDIGLYKATLKAYFHANVIETEQELTKEIGYHPKFPTSSFAECLETLKEGYYLCFTTINYTQGGEKIIHDFINRTKTYCVTMFLP